MAFLSRGLFKFEKSVIAKIRIVSKKNGNLNDYP